MQHTQSEKAIDLVGNALLGNALLRFPPETQVKILGVVEQVLEGLDQRDKLARHAIDEWLRDYSKALETDKEAVFHALEAAETLEAVVRFHQGWICRETTRRRLQLDEEGLEIARKQMIFAINAHESIDPRETWSLDLFQLTLSKPEPDKGTETKLSSVVDLAKAMANDMSTAALEAIHDGRLPSEWQPLLRRDGQASFISQLAELLMATGQEGRRAVNLILTDTDIASAVSKDERMAKPLRALASLVLEPPQTAAVTKTTTILRDTSRSDAAGR